MRKKIDLMLLTILIGNFCLAQNTYNVFTYKTPAGYKEDKKQGFVTYSKTNATKGTFCIIALYNQTTASGTLDANFDANWQELVVQPYNVTTKPEKQNSEDQEGWKVKLGVANFEYEGSTSMAMLATLQQGSAIANILFLTNGKEYLTEFDALLNSLKMGMPLNNTASTNVLNTASKLTGGIAGVWLAYTKESITSTSLKWKAYVFFNNGKVLSEDIPYIGLLNYDANTYKYGYTQQYEFNGSTGKLIEYQSTPTPMKLVKPNQIKIGTTDYYKSDNLNGKEIEGDFSFIGFKKEDYVAYGYLPIIHFNKQGSFADDGFLFLLSDDKKQVNGISAKQGTGTYSINEYTIVLKYSDGRTNTIPIATPYGAKADDAKMFLIHNQLVGRVDGGISNKSTKNVPTTNGQTNNTKASSSNLPKIFNGHSFVGTGLFADYTFSDIPECTVQQFSDAIQYTHKTEYRTSLLTLLPLRNYNGESLEATIKVIYKDLFSGYKINNTDSYELGYSYWEKGKTIQGFDYLKVSISLVGINDYNQKMDGLVALIKVNNKLAVIWGTQGFQNGDYGYGATANNMFNQVMFSLKFNNVTSPSFDFKQALIGKWSSIGGSVSLVYNYYKNNSFVFGGASQFRTSKDAYYDNVTTTSYGMDGSYGLEGNSLTTFYNKKKTIDMIRFYESLIISENADEQKPWEKHMYSITIEGGYNNEDCWTKNLRDMGVRFSNN